MGQTMATSVSQAPGFQRWKIADIVVTALNDGFIILPPEILLGIDAEQQDALYPAAGRRPPFATAINGYPPRARGAMRAARGDRRLRCFAKGGHRQPALDARSRGPRRPADRRDAYAVPWLHAHRPRS